MRPADDGVAWFPTAHDLERSRMLRFAREWVARASKSYVSAARPIRPGSGGRWSRRLAWPGRARPATVLDLSDGLPWAHWFPGAGLNHTAQALDRWVGAGRGDAPALLWQGEEGRAPR